MRRRVSEGHPPPVLAIYDPQEWPARTRRESLRAWKDARRLWDAAYGWPGGPVARIREERQVRRALEDHR